MTQEGNSLALMEVRMILDNFMRGGMAMRCPKAKEHTTQNSAGKQRFVTIC